MKSPWKNFSYAELGCKCGKCSADSGMNISKELMDQVQQLREICGFPFVITSAYRCPDHPVEAGKSKPGTHANGQAVDIQVSGNRAHLLLQEALKMPSLNGIGVNQKGNHSSRFIHLDVATGENRPWVWSY